MSYGLFVCGTGLVTPVGRNADDTYWSMVTGIRRFRRGPVVGFDGHPLRVSPVMPISTVYTGIVRRCALLSPALMEAISAARITTHSKLTRAGLVLCPGLDEKTLFSPTTTRAILSSITGILGRPIDEQRLTAASASWNVQELLARVVDTLKVDAGVEVPDEWRAIAQGEHSSGILALDTAVDILRTRRAEWCVVAAVDTACEPARLEMLDAMGRIQSQRVRVGPIPGEGAAVLCLRKDRPSTAGSGIFELRKWAHARETADAALGGAWSDAIEAVMDNHAAPSVGFTMVDLNGDRSRAQAWSFAAHRTIGRRGLTPELMHPADVTGDMYAATGPLLLGLAGRHLHQHAGRSAGLIACSSTFGQERSATIVTVDGANS